MSAQPTSEKSKRSISLTATLATAFVMLTILSLLLASGLQTVLNFRAQQEIVAARQQITAQEAAQEVANFIEQMFGVLESAVQVVNPFAGTVEEQQALLEKLLGVHPALREVTLLDDQGQELVKLSRMFVVTKADLANRANSDLFKQVSLDQRYISPVHIDETTSEPLVTMAVPVKNVFGDFEGALVAEVNLKFMWDLVDTLEVGQEGLAYVVDRQGNLIAFGDTSRVLRGENLRHLDEVAEFVNSSVSEDKSLAGDISTGINDTSVLSTWVSLGQPDWIVLVELPVTEAYQAVILNVAVSVGVLLVVAALAGVAGVYLARRLAAPLLNLAQTATRIAAGELELAATVEGPTEVADLATVFNSMTAQLRGLIGSLEQQVAARTQRLEIVAALGDQLTAILKLEELLAEVVNQVQKNFDYYHAHIYLFDEVGDNLVVAAGTGEAGAKMKARGHSIPLSAPASLVARAARSAEVVRVDNVREADDWLPNPLLPDTYAEMAVQIIAEGQVVGVLDVQQDKIGGLDEGDATLLRSLANHVAVAIRNARLFAEVQAALSEAHTAQTRYLEQAWEQAQIDQQRIEHHYQRPDASPLAERVLTQLEQQAREQDYPTIVPVAEEATAQQAQAEPHTALVAPIKLQEQTIGAIQLQETGDSQQRQWSERELALVQVVANQVAQVAENLRLFKETQERAGREQTIREITDKLRTAPSLDVLLETAARELGQRLRVRHTVLELGVEAERSNSELDTPLGDDNGQV